MKLLLDVHIAASVVNAIRKRQPGLDVQHLAGWKRGVLREAEDAEILDACAGDRRVWVTYDLATVPDLLSQFAEEGRDHAGVFFADDASLPPEDIGALTKAISDLVEELAGANTTNLVRFLRRSRL